MIQNFPNSHEPFGGDNVKVDLSNCATKVDKLVPLQVDLGKLSDEVKSDVKKTVYDKLVVKVNNIDTSRLVLKNEYDTDKTELKNKIPDTRCLVKKTDYNARITATEFQLPSISGLATNAALTAVEIGIPNISSLLKKKQIITQKILKSKKNLLIITMVNMLLLQSLIL